MYNGIGLSTVRGSGTNGYVQRNLSTLQLKNQAPYDEDAKSSSSSSVHVGYRAPNKDIIEHERKRLIEVKCMKLRDELEEQGTKSEEDIDIAVDELRQELLSLERMQSNENPLHDEEKDLNLKALSGTHQINQAKERENVKLMNAFGIKKDEYIEGSSFDPEIQAKKKADRHAQFEKRQAEREKRVKEREKLDSEQQENSRRETERHIREKEYEMSRKKRIQEIQASKESSSTRREYNDYSSKRRRAD